MSYSQSQTSFFVLVSLTILQTVYLNWNMLAPSTNCSNTCRQRRSKPRPDFSSPIRQSFLSTCPSPPLVPVRPWVLLFDLTHSQRVAEVRKLKLLHPLDGFYDRGKQSLDLGADRVLNLCDFLLSTVTSVIDVRVADGVRFFHSVVQDLIRTLDVIEDQDTTEGHCYTDDGVKGEGLGLVSVGPFP